MATPTTAATRRTTTTTGTGTGIKRTKQSSSFYSMFREVVSPCGRSQRYMPHEEEDGCAIIINKGSNGGVAHKIKHFQQEEQRRKEQFLHTIPTNHNCENHRNKEEEVVVVGNKWQEATATKKDNQAPIKTKTTTTTNTKSKQKQTPKKNKKKDATATYCDKCHDMIYPTDTTIRAFTHLFHIQCFRCCLCHHKMQPHAQEVCVDIPISADNEDSQQEDDNNDEIYLMCVPCQEKSHATYCVDNKVQAATAGDRIVIQDNEGGDLAAIMDEIGDDLERIVFHNYLPTCTICGGNFLNYQHRVVVLGARKYHEECWELGQPSASVNDRKQTPCIAVQSLPTQVVGKFFYTARQQQQQQQQVVTLLFVWNTRLDDCKRWQQQQQPQPQKQSSSLIVPYTLDDAIALTRKTVLFENRNNNNNACYYCELVGNPFGVKDEKKLLSQQHSNSAKKNQGSTFFEPTVLSYVKFELRHWVRIQIPFVTTTMAQNNNNEPIRQREKEQRWLDFTQARLIVQVVDEEETTTTATTTRLIIDQ